MVLPLWLFNMASLGVVISVFMGFIWGENIFGIIFGYLGKFSLRTVGQLDVHVDRIIFLKDP
jgi:hypothetical protein